MGNTKKVFDSSEYLKSGLRTDETVFQTTYSKINAGMKFVEAFERYETAADSQISQKARPALNCLRFSTLFYAETRRAEKRAVRSVYQAKYGENACWFRFKPLSKVDKQRLRKSQKTGIFS